ncbi:unnamed protein product [Penicillium salamii]|nr:unnamed protein product [Penicillium salamii]CAG8155386.1 unnamed protein product [Penicillium salamii]CAG8329887.1 unnamed protein product [Penicillium salamii]
MEEDIGPFQITHWLQPKAVAIGQHIETREKVLIRTENATPNLEQEATILRALSGGIGFQTLYWFGETHNQKIIITNTVGMSLEDAFEKSNRFFDMSLVLEIASQLIFRLEWMHSHNLFHGKLTPDSFSLGGSRWQTPQVVLNGFQNIDTSENAARKDLEAVADILVYLAIGPASWESFQAEKPDFVDIPSALKGFILILSDQEINPADYLIPRAYFHAARRSLAGRTILGGLGDPQERHSCLKYLASKDTNELFDTLGSKLVAVGSAFGDLTWGGDETKYLFESLDEIMAIYLVLLLRDKPTPKRRTYLMGAYHLPNRLWRDFRWYLCTGKRGAASIQILLNLTVYKYMGVLLEVIPSYNRYWAKFLSETAYFQMKIDSDSYQFWRNAWIYWKHCSNFLSKTSM